jgi:photosynthetic reaction center cytochrome c subunit
VAPADQKNCTYGHNGENYADESKYQYKVARSMLKMTRDINTNWKSHVKETGVTCHTCHRGGPVPQYVWYADPGSGRENAFVGTRAGQNSAVTGLGITTIGHSSLPYDPYSPFLLGDLDIRVNGPTA